MHASADRVATVATSIGMGLVAFMVMWIVGVRIAERIWDPPASALAAMVGALGVGLASGIVAGRRLK